MNGYTITAGLIGFLFCAIAVKPSLFSRKGKS